MASVPDQKKVADLVNAAGYAAQDIRTQVALLKTLRTTYLAVNPNVAGTPLAGNLSTLSAAIDTLDTAASAAIWTTMINAIVPSHQGNSL